MWAGAMGFFYGVYKLASFMDKSKDSPYSPKEFPYGDLKDELAGAVSYPAIPGPQCAAAVPQCPLFEQPARPTPYRGCASLGSTSSASSGIPTQRATLLACHACALQRCS
mmetsp:Transcript_28713/g.91635  ORF Transcript_28713/g.91635 Transcript_28713/m.91635 type:complete len:110 (+) Transcript_28713:561-890(+)